MIFLGDFEKGGNLKSLSRCEEASDYPDEIQVATQVLTSLDRTRFTFFWHFQLLNVRFVRDRIFVREDEPGSRFGAPERGMKGQPGGKIRGAVGNTLGPPGNDFGPPVGKKTKFAQGSVTEESRACHTR